MSNSTTMSENKPAPVQASEEVLAVHRRMQQRRQLNRALTYLVAAVLALWILVPLWLLGSMAFTTPETVRSYPKGILPFIPFSFETMKFFLTSEGIVPGVINSVIVAVITLVLSTLIAAPAGYATSR
jgi:multiple sugar transport system permease protein